MSDIRKLAIALLDDENGINGEAWDQLKVLLLCDEQGDNKDIINAVEESKGRFFLPEDMFKAE